ncbi:hypothetical protein [Winogradskyella luteola]|uniref:Uncharacterized protein n=1 Tax=Winogradskyella luteola TaxID=2828330 RepID=A0A9X1F7I5_9FLAO|nr:hypothetical protein [Winogradskyella luteola]MBV7268063.1 hypothetical protein [Winogradskyella luteola]
MNIKNILSTSAHTLLIFLVFCSCNEKVKTKVVEPKIEFDYDFSGVDQFLAITDSLEDNVNVSEAAWDNLFETKGYKALKNNEYIKSIITLVFNPERQGRLDTLLILLDIGLKEI